MKMRTKLFIGFGVLLLLMFALAGIGLNRMTSIDRSLDDMYKNQYEKLRLISLLKTDVYNLGKNTSNLLLSKDKDSQIKNEEAIQAANSKLNVTMEQVNNAYTTEAEKQIANDILDKSRKYISLQGQIKQLVVNGNMDAAIALRGAQGTELQDDVMTSANNMTRFQENAMNSALKNAKMKNSETVAYTGLLTLIGLFLGGGVMFWILVGLTKGLHMMTGMIRNIETSGSSSSQRIHIASNDEFGDLVRVFNEMTLVIEEKSESERALGKLSSDQAWLKTNLAHMSTMLQGLQDLSGFAFSFIGEVCRMTESSYGAFYVKKELQGQKYLQLYSTYARSSNDQITSNAKLEFGQGLPGQCAQDKKAIFLKEIPPDYVKVSSAFGQIAPLSILIQPILFEDEIVAVYEIASLKTYTELHLELAEQLSESMGILLNNIRGRMKVEELLRISQNLTQELQNQSEELLTHQNELRGSYDKMERQAQELSVASKYKSEFLANMSHELRTPLNSMLILSQLLADNKEGNLTEKQIEYAETVHSSGQELLNLIDDVLDLSKIESGRLDLQRDTVMILEINQSLRRVFLPLAERKGLNLNIRIDEDAPEQIFTDRQRLMQILKNLLSNAIKFTSHGEVKLEIYRDRFQSSMVAFAVEDTGIGISADKHEMIFEAFRQADGTTGRKYGGTGLGLSISREFATLLGGEIQLQSSVGEGSRFTLLLPELSSDFQSEVLKQVATSHESAMLKQTSPPIPVQWGEPSRKISMDLTGKKLLLVVDIRNLYSLSNLLESNGMKVVHAENGIGAIETLKSDPAIDLVIMDVMMPEMDGYQAMRNIREMTQFQKLPIIALTAKVMKEDKEKCIQAGASDYLTKPVQVDQLMSIINLWLFNHSEEGSAKG
ncbi:ATP-binding protein [Paenibacillus sp. GP183]|uniref:sensor histidine kinase n=1 Tax=Paenibacillus sp. GP183 TaxID=1882751 RepID=UPI0008979D44|nr:ATP-binding protein [Paenibacillus sp. GP183]SEB66803.1 two-component system, chemotaxis family, sensor kinase CheA [Paenibacillus sp. GP183]